MESKNRYLTYLTIGSLAFALSVPVNAQQASWAKLRRLSGPVEVRKSAKTPWKKARRNQILLPGSEIRTKKGATATIYTKEKHRVRLSQKTRVQFEKASKRDTSFKVLIGRMRAFVKRLRKKSRFRVKTPIAVASVRGTEFDTDVKEDETSSFDVLKGIVDVSDIAEIGQEVKLFKNQRTTVIKGQAPTKPETFSPEEIRGQLRNRRDSNKTKQLARLEARREIGLQKFKEQLQADVNFEQRISEYQDGKTVIDAFGMRVRIEEYIVRPQPNQFSFVTINTRLENVSFSRYDAWSLTALPTKLNDINFLFSRTGTAGNKPNNYITRQKWFVSNGSDIYREFSEGGDMIFFNDIGQSLWQVVFAHWFVELRGANSPGENFRLVSHWTPHPNFLSGADSTPNTENIGVDGVLDMPQGYVNFESATDAGTLIGDTRPVDAVDFATRLINTNIFGNAAYQASEGYVRESKLELNNVDFSSLPSVSAKINALLNARKASALHTYKDSDGTTVVTRLRVDEYNVTDTGKTLSRLDIINSGLSVDSVNFESVSTSNDFTGKLDLILTPRIFRKAGLIN